MTTKDGYKLRRDAYAASAEHNHTLLCYFFGKEVVPVAEACKRLNEKLEARKVDQMGNEITEINDMGLTRLGGDR